MSENVDLYTLEAEKKNAEAKVIELELALEKAKKEAFEKKELYENIKNNSTEVLKNDYQQESRNTIEDSEPSIIQEVEKKTKSNGKEISQKDSLKTAKAKRKEALLQEKEAEKIERKKKMKVQEEKQLQNLKKALLNRSKGKTAADPGNDKVKHTSCEVFIYCVDDNEFQLKVLLEQFKNTRSFKKAKGFGSGTDLLKYLKTRKYPKKSIIIVVMDYFLENSTDEDAQNGISVLADIKEYDPDIDVIMLSSSEDVDVVDAASRFGAVTFIKKGSDAFSKLVNNIVWTIREKEQIRKKMDTKNMVKSLIIGFVLVIIALVVTDRFYNLGIGFYPQKPVPANTQTSQPNAEQNTQPTNTTTEQ